MLLKQSYCVTALVVTPSEMRFLKALNQLGTLAEPGSGAERLH